MNTIHGNTGGDSDATNQGLGGGIVPASVLETLNGEGLGGGLPTGPLSNMATVDEGGMCNQVPPAAASAGATGELSGNSDLSARLLGVIDLTRNKMRKSKRGSNDGSPEDVANNRLRRKKYKKIKHLGSSDEEMSITESDPPGTYNEGSGMLTRRMATCGVHINTSDDSIPTGVNLKPFKYEEMENMDFVQLKRLGAQFVETVEEARSKSKNISGRVTRTMRDYLESSKDVIRLLCDRLEDSGDATYLKIRKVELERELKANKTQMEEMRTQMVSMEKEIKELRATTEKMMRHNEDLCKRGSAHQYTAEITEESSVGRPDTDFEEREDEIYKTKFPPLKNRAVDIAEDIEQQLKEVNQFISDAISKKKVLLEAKARAAKLREDTEFLTPSKPAPSNRSKSKVRIVENIMIKPPRTSISSVDSSGRVQNLRNDMRLLTPVGNRATPTRNVRDESIRRRRPPRYAAVTITGKNADFSYAEAIKRARHNIDTEKLGIQKGDMKIRRALNGGLVIEVVGGAGGEKADKLAEELGHILENEAYVNRPIAKGELRIVGFDGSVSQEEIIDVIANRGNCTPRKIRTSNVRPLGNGLNSIWVQCPLNTAINLANEKKLCLGWTVARVELLQARPFQCFKCWAYGHVRTNC